MHYWVYLNQTERNCEHFIRIVFKCHQIKVKKSHILIKISVKISDSIFFQNPIARPSIRCQWYAWRQVSLSSGEITGSTMPSLMETLPAWLNRPCLIKSTVSTRVEYFWDRKNLPIFWEKFLTTRCQFYQSILIIVLKIWSNSIKKLNNDPVFGTVSIKFGWWI